MAEKEILCKYKRSHSAMNTNPVVPSFALLAGKVDGGGSFCEDPVELAKTIGLTGEVMVWVNDESDSEGEKASLAQVELILDLMPARVGGPGFSSNAKVYDWLDKGATKVVVSYSESQLGFLDGVPKDRISILITVQGSTEEGATLAGGRQLKEAMDEISYYADSIMMKFQDPAAPLDRTAVEKAKEALSKGMRLALLDAASNTDDVGWTDSIGVESVLCKKMQDGSLPLEQALGAALVSDRPDGLIPTVVVDEDLVSLGLCYSNLQSVREAVVRRVGVYWSRTRGLWIKGLTSGATQELLRIDLDCDRDAMRFVVRQSGVGFCHMEQMSCFGDDHGTLGALMRTLIDRKKNAPAGSYTKRLFDDPALLKSKLLEECEELLAAEDTKEVAWETADVVYFAFAACARHEVNLAQVQRNLARKALRVRRRPGNAKPAGWKPGDPSPDKDTAAGS